VPEPGRDQSVVALDGPRSRALGTPPERPEPSRERRQAVADAESAPDQARNPPERPALGVEPGGLGARRQQREEVLPLGRAQRGGTAGVPPSLQPRQAPPRGAQPLGPPAHRRATDAHPPGNLGLRQVAAAQQAPGGPATLLELR